MARRRAAKTDENQKRIVATLRKHGVEVRVMSDTGQGWPDLATCYANTIRLLEIKDADDEHQAMGMLTELQKKLMKKWPVSVVYDEESALKAVGVWPIWSDKQ